MKWLVAALPVVLALLLVAACSGGVRMDLNGDTQLEGRTGVGQPVQLEPRDPKRSESSSSSPAPSDK